MSLSDNVTKVAVTAIAGAVITVMSLFGEVPSFVWGALAVLATVALMAYVLGLRQPTPEELQGMIQDALVEGLDAYDDVAFVRDEEEDQ